MYYINMLFDSPAEIRKQNYVGEWKSQCSLSWKKSSKLKDGFLKNQSLEEAACLEVMTPAWVVLPVAYYQGAPPLPIRLVIIVICDLPPDLLRLWMWLAASLCIPDLSASLCIPHFSSGGRFASAALLENP